MGQKLCPEKKLDNGFFPKIDVALVGWRPSFKLLNKHVFRKSEESRPRKNWPF